MLKRFSFTIIPILLFLVFSCSSKKTLVSPETQIVAAYNAQDYPLVLQLFERMEQNDKSAEMTSNIIEMAGKSAYYTNNWDKTHIYLTRIVNASSNPELIDILGSNYLNWGKKDFEYQHWNKYLHQLQGTLYYQTATTRIFLFEIEKEQFNKAGEIWTKIPDKSDPDLKFEYLRVLENLDQKKQALAYSLEILKEYPSHEPTLFWRARNFYDKAESLYQSEMTKYNRNPDYTSYAYLRRELKVVSEDYRTARDLFIKLREIKPEQLTYIRYLRNCYIRLEMKAEAAKLDQLLNEPNKK